MSVSAVVLAAGKGRRFRSKIPKPFVCLGGKPVIGYCLEVFRRRKEISEIIVVVPARLKAEARRFLAEEGLPEAKLVAGGERRQDSVSNALKVIDPRSELVLIHDGVRPFVTGALVAKLITEARASGAACLAVPAKSTIKSVKRRARRLVVTRTLDRGSLWETQTPQVFEKGLLCEAYRRHGKQSVTDDASLVERLGHQVTVVKGEYSNIKITTPEDLAVAEALLKIRKSSS